MRATDNMSIRVSFEIVKAQRYCAYCNSGNPIRESKEFSTFQEAIDWCYSKGYKRGNIIKYREL